MNVRQLTLAKLAARGGVAETGALTDAVIEAGRYRRIDWRKANWAVCQALKVAARRGEAEQVRRGIWKTLVPHDAPAPGYAPPMREPVRQVVMEYVETLGGAEFKTCDAIAAVKRSGLDAHERTVYRALADLEEARDLVWLRIGVWKAKGKKHG